MKAAAVLLLSAAMATSVMAGPAARRAKCGPKPGPGSASITYTASETTSSASNSPITITSTAVETSTSTSTTTLTVFSDFEAITIVTATVTVAPNPTTVAAPDGFEGAEETQAVNLRRGLRANWMWARQNGTAPMSTSDEPAPPSTIFPAPTPAPSSTTAIRTPATTMVITSTTVVVTTSTATTTVTRTTGTQTITQTVTVTDGPTPTVYAACQRGNYLTDLGGYYFTTTDFRVAQTQQFEATSAEDCCVKCLEDPSCVLNYWNVESSECFGQLDDSANPQCDARRIFTTVFTDDDALLPVIMVSNGKCGRWSAVRPRVERL
ncbi:PAN-like domain-containing protein [Microdochium nivale]|nr:PAN-like domain-containing protein [Microdochium nivale]